MIRAEELRNGNLILDEDGIMMYLSHLKPSKHGWRYVDSAGNSELLKLCSSIPLTPEILEKAGFVKEAFWYSINMSPFTSGREYKVLGVDLNQGMYIRQGELVEARHKDDLVSIYNIDVSGKITLHQLQNLYFALTGKELTLTP